MNFLAGLQKEKAGTSSRTITTVNCVWAGNDPHTCKVLDISEKVIYMNTFTKTLASTVRISYNDPAASASGTVFIRSYHFIPVRYQTLNNIPWICLSKKDISKNILTGLRNYYQIRKMDSYLPSGIVVCTNAWKYPGKRPVCIS